MNINPILNNVRFGNANNKPDEGKKGYFVHENPIEAVGGTVTSYAKRVKYAKDAVQGKGSDYSIGNINDLTIGLGSLGIAAILASMTKKTSTKIMEFAGFGSFFAAMSIWPKVFIADPLKAKTGFDVMQEYVDSSGQRKRFFEDPQYLPWDLYNSDQLNKIGDKLNVPRNIENRESHIKDKMKQVSIQANTLWMLTAGFATPLMASLMGNSISKYVEKVLEATRVKSAIKTAGLDDFTTEQKQGKFKEIFVNPLANLFSIKSEYNPKATPEEELKSLDKAFDAVFGKSDDSEYEYNKARLLYDNVPEDKTLVRYDSDAGETIIKDASGKVIKKIQTKNVDGVSMFGNKWANIPTKLTQALGINTKKYKQMISETMQVGKNGATKEEHEIIADMLLNEFGGSENKVKLEKALKDMEKILTPSIQELDGANTKFSHKINEVKSHYENAINESTNEALNKQLAEKLQYIVNIQQDRLYNKVANTKMSWYSPVRILDIIRKTSDKPLADVKKEQAIKEELGKFIYGTTAHQINNNFDDVIKDVYNDEQRYFMGLDKSFAPISDETKKIFGDNKFINDVDKTIANVKNDLINATKDPKHIEKPTKIQELISDKTKHFEDVCEWLGKTPQALIKDSAVQNGIYKGWLKKAGFAFAGLVGVTMFAISQFGKTNSSNPDVYKYKYEGQE